jgi:hypothetical protein
VYKETLNYRLLHLIYSVDISLFVWYLWKHQVKDLINVLYNNGIKITKYLYKAQYTIIIGGKNARNVRERVSLGKIKRFRNFFKSLFSFGVQLPECLYKVLSSVIFSHGHGNEI